jgi:CheY-like chemotaxis protein
MQSSTRATVMVVDDYDDCRAMMKCCLDEAGYRVIEATDGREAVAMAERERPELILMDLTLPEIDGFAATVRIRTHAELCHVPIIAISAYAELEIDAQLRTDPRAMGFNAYLPKPFVPEKLLDLVGQYLPKSRGKHH